MHWIVLRAEIDTYHGLEPAVRVVILKALCDIRVEVLFWSRYFACDTCFMRLAPPEILHNSCFQ